MSFYRIYRPQIIEEIDNVAVREQLLSFLTKKREELPHAYLFYGPRGSGKTTSARIIAKLFNCEHPTKHGPCGTCNQCASIALGNNMDVLELDAASNRGIDEIRALRDTIALTPSAALYKLYIIDEVHMLTTEAFNALLKTLEEPPPHVIFILATTDLQKVPITIRSRCMVISFSRADDNAIIQALLRIVTKEKLDISSSVLSKIASYADGSFRDGVKLLEQISFHKGKVTDDVVEKLLSMSSEQVIDNFLNALLKQDVKESLMIIEQLHTEGKDIKVFVTEILYKLEKLLVSVASGIESQAWTLSNLKDLIRILSQAFIEMRGVSIVQLPFELAVVEYCEEQRQPIIKSNLKVLTQKVIVQSQKPVEEASHGLLTLEKLIDFWKDFIEAMKPYNHSIAGVLRSSQPKSVERGVVTIEAFYPFHLERLSEGKARDMIAEVLKKLFGEKVKVEIILGKK